MEGEGGGEVRGESEGSVPAGSAAAGSAAAAATAAASYQHDEEGRGAASVAYATSPTRIEGHAQSPLKLPSQQPPHMTPSSSEVGATVDPNPNPRKHSRAEHHEEVGIGRVRPTAVELDGKLLGRESPLDLG